MTSACQAIWASAGRPLGQRGGLAEEVPGVCALCGHVDDRTVPLYRCVRLAEAPGRVRKSWWLPGKAATQGGTIWLRTYYPSLFAQLRRLLPQHGQFA